MAGRVEYGTIRPIRLPPRSARLRLVARRALAGMGGPRRRGRASAWPDPHRGRPPRCRRPHRDRPHSRAGFTCWTSGKPPGASARAAAEITAEADAADLAAALRTGADACARHLIGDRFDITGARYWRYRLAREHQRLYPGTAQDQYALRA